MRQGFKIDLEMMANDGDQMQVDFEADYEPEVDVVRWDGDPEPDLESIIKIESIHPTVTVTNDQIKSRTLISATSCDPNTLAKAHEEASKKAVLLRRNELKWKLMQVSQVQNKARLGEIKTEMTYHREKLSKTQDLAARLREKYVRVIKSAKLSEAQLKKAENQFQSQEKFVAAEKMELTKLAFDCVNIGKSLFGEGYKLPANPEAPPPAARPRVKNPRVNKKSQLMSSKDEETTASSSSSLAKSIETDQGPSDSILENLVVYRLVRNLAKKKPLTHSHNYSPNSYVCLPDLISHCTDKGCNYMHKSSYLKSDLQKLCDLLGSSQTKTLDFLLERQTKVDAAN